MSAHSRVHTSITAPVWAGAVFLALAFGGFGAWAGTAPLQGAVVVSGTVVTLGGNSVVQHLEGGIVESVSVIEGQTVQQGDTLLTLDDTGARTVVQRLRAELEGIRILEARLLAERDGSSQIELSRSPVEHTSTATLVVDQTTEFNARLQRHFAESKILDEQIQALRDEIIGVEAQQEALELQLELTREGKADVQALLKEGLIQKRQWLQLRSQEAVITGQLGQLAATVARLNQSIAEKEQEKQRLLNGRVEQASAELTEIRRKRADLTEQLTAAEDLLDRTSVMAKVSGTITNLTHIGVGSVLQPGQKILEIVPANAELLVETRVLPRDINRLYLEQSARLVFTALDRENGEQLTGNITYISADKMQSDRTGEHYYLTRVAVPLDRATELGIGPGHPVEVYIATGERTFFDYVLDPLASAFDRGLREQ